MIVLFVLLAGQVGAFLILFWAVISSFRSVDYIIKGLTFSFIIFLANPVLFSAAMTSTVSTFRFLYIFIAFSIVFYKVLKSKQKSNHLFILNLFFIFLILHSFLFTYSIEISILKSLLFYVGAFTCVGAFSLSTKSRLFWEQWFISFFVVVVILSLPIVFFPSIGMARYSNLHSTQLFQGITNHPQTFALFLSLPIAYFLGNAFRNKLDYSTYFFLVLSLFLLILSSGRTGLVAVLLGFIALKLIRLFNKTDFGFFYWMGTSGRRLKVFSIVFFLVALSPLLFPIAKKFVYKREYVKDLGESFTASRLDQVLSLVDNINNHPYTGIGFGLPSNIKTLDDVIKRDPFFGLPIGAATEKGFLPIAVLEELGLFGLVFFSLFLIFNLITIGKVNNLSFAWVIITAIMGNVGEMMFFSFGGIGLLMWLLIGLGLKRK